MNKRQLHHVWTKIRVVRPEYFLVICAVSGVVAIGTLRNNNVHTLALRDEVLLADKNDGNVELALHNLRGYMYGHMNTSLTSGANAIKPPIQLKYRYDRLVAAEKVRVTTDQARLTVEAQTVCERQFPQGTAGGPLLPCIQNYIAINTPVEKTIPDSLYKFDFVSPTWSPDVAGWSLLLAGVSLLVFVLTKGLDMWVKYELRKQVN